MLLFAQHGAWPARAAVLAGVAANLLLTFGAFWLAAKFSHMISATIAAMVTRIFGIILAALAAQFVIDGIKNVFAV
jgi:multiple antibiotic resistance protein